MSKLSFWSKLSFFCRRQFLLFWNFRTSVIISFTGRALDVPAIGCFPKERVWHRCSVISKTGRAVWTGTMTHILEQLKWESLKTRRRDSILLMLYKDLKDAVSVHTNEIVTSIKHVRKHHFFWHFNPSLLILAFKKAVSSLRLLEIRIMLSVVEGAEDCC